jgi:hypothetical protein
MIDKFTQAYIEALLWSSTDDDGNPLDDWATADDIAPEAMERIKSDCEDFLSDPLANGYCAGVGLAQSGHDFWLTRNHHGAGFWDRGYPDSIGSYLTDRAHAYGECDAYVGDDGLVYLS